MVWRSAPYNNVYLLICTRADWKNLLDTPVVTHPRMQIFRFSLLIIQETKVVWYLYRTLLCCNNLTLESSHNILNTQHARSSTRACMSIGTEKKHITKCCRYECKFCSLLLNFVFRNNKRKYVCFLSSHISAAGIILCGRGFLFLWFCFSYIHV